jgi:hypothetical protein
MTVLALISSGWKTLNYATNSTVHACQTETYSSDNVLSSVSALCMTKPNF